MDPSLRSVPRRWLTGLCGRAQGLGETGYVDGRDVVIEYHGWRVSSIAYRHSWRCKTPSLREKNESSALNCNLRALLLKHRMRVCEPQ